MNNHEPRDKQEMEPAKGQFLVYQAEDDKLKLDARFEDESVWLTQQLMADLFQTTKQNISLHIQNIYEEGELVPKSTVKKYLTVRQEGSREVKRLLDYYNLDMIISVGYRIKSHVATRFRIWATQKLTEFIRKGFVLDDERLFCARTAAFMETVCSVWRRCLKSNTWKRFFDIKFSSYS